MLLSIGLVLPKPSEVLHAIDSVAREPRGRARCGLCGAGQHLIFLEPDEPVFCCACIDQARFGLHTAPEPH